jgi:hypothetical protein
MPGPVAADATSVYWSNLGDKTLMKAPVAGVTATVVVPATSEVVNGLIVNGGFIYFGRGTSAYRVPVAGGTPLVLMTSPENGKPSGFALDGGYLYNVELLHNAVTREKADGTQPIKTRDGGVPLPEPDRIAVSQGGLLHDAVYASANKTYWVDNTQLKSKVVLGDGQDEFRPLTPVINSSGFASISGFVVAGSTIYLGTELDDTIEKGPTAGVDGGAADSVVIAKNQKKAAQFAADTASIYWATSDCHIMKLAK